MIGWLGWLGSALVVVSLSLDDQRSFRIVNLAASCVMLAVNFAIGMTSMVVLNLVLIAINARHIVRMRRFAHTEATSDATTRPAPARRHAHTDEHFATAA